MRRLAVIRHQPEPWIAALRAAEPRLEVRGCHPRDLATFDLDWLAEAEGLFCWKLPEGLLPLMPRLRWIQNSGAGMDHLVRHPGLPESVVLSRADGRFGFWMARYVVGHLLFDAQHVSECAAAAAEGRWNPKLVPEDLWGQRAVVVGFGRIGRQIGRALRELGLSVEGVVRSPREDPEFPLYGPDALAERVQGARLLVLCAPSTPETRDLVNRQILAQASPRLLLVNVGRGEQVNLPDLLEALDAGSLGGAVLDVFPEEPLPADSPLWKHPKLRVTPHHSGPSLPEALVEDILPALRCFAEGGIPAGIDRQKGY